ncbi:NACHT domain-containing NTPase [Actinoplanes sp. L3-i22]|uniref:NACHT domain-containing protein n=1 Tax=Actinoplanes sp. L3-i22 TaxID=2836373 RepID=UPI001C761E95|nr:hypothetical protein [Actinoplanes sp. L3-i22]BCY07570.1 hypothetical protein L3i22_026580 [Actinoplanes sp. L3-i22]
MNEGLGYADAVRLLGGQDSKVVSALEKVTGGLMLAGTASGTPIAAPLLGWFDAKGEFVRLSHELVRGLAEKRSGLSRFSRTERLEAAHAVIALAAFFTALAAVLPPDLRKAAPDRDEQIALAGGTSAADSHPLPAQLLRITPVRPAPQEAPETFRARLLDYYGWLGESVHGFLRGHIAFYRLSEAETRRLEEGIPAVPKQACERYDESFRQLVAEFPEVACWASQREHRATRAALADLEETLRAISTGQLPDDRRAGLATAYRAELRRPVVQSGDVPDGLRVPTLGEAYLPPRFRTADVPSAARVSEESWWSAVPVRDDLEKFLIGHLTSSQGMTAPLLVLGQPGSGKSVLTRVFAARLPAEDFLPIRVILRDVPAADDVQDQIELAVRQATGEQVGWTVLARSAGDAMPVILLDGFDELLQAVGVSQTDYLERVARFQRREAEQGRPVAVVVTSRTAVADRARTPEGTVALRLEPFDESRVTRWLAIWNATNAANFAARGLEPLGADAVLAHGDLAEQPLLLLMLALYDADGNALQRDGGDLRTHELYERLLRRFAAREITKQRPGLPGSDLEQAIQLELRRLSVVAFAMFNRAALWITEADLEADLGVLFGTARPAPSGGGLRVPLRAAELALGRFFFIHRAQAAQQEARLETFEFLHATFGEFLVARLTRQVLGDMTAREAASTMSFGGEAVDDDLLRALLSFEPLSLRGPILEFLAEMLEPAARPATRDLLVRLFRRVNHTPPGARFAEYRPQIQGEPARYATYSANLLLLLTVAAESISASELFDSPVGAVDAWRRQALLWRSQLSVDGWESLIDVVALDRIRVDGSPDVLLSRTIEPAETPPIDLNWSARTSLSSRLYRAGPANTRDAVLRREAYFQCSDHDDIAMHALEPLFTGLPTSVGTLIAWDHPATDAASTAHSLLAALIRPSRDAYLRCAQIAASDFRPYGNAFAILLLDRLSADQKMTPKTVADVLDMVTRNDTTLLNSDLLTAAVRCALAFLGQDDLTDRRLLSLLVSAVFGLVTVKPLTRAEALVRLYTMGAMVRVSPSALLTTNLEELIRDAKARPDLVAHLRRIQAEWPVADPG